MPQVAFDGLPDDARVWVFGASHALDDQASAALLREVDLVLADWQAHGVPLTCAREWRDRRFLAVGVDESVAAASGCSVDALFAVLRDVERRLGTTLVAGGRLFYRDADRHVQCVDRETYAARVRAGVVRDDTPVFDTTLTRARHYRSGFERAASSSWHARI